MAISPKTQAWMSFESGYDLLRLFGSHQMIVNALKRRFNGLPIHRLCYYQSYYPTDVTIDQLKLIVAEQNEAPFDKYNNQDCLGMTPLHILACSTKQNLDIVQFIVATYPKHLVTKDKWDCFPLLYAIWFGASQVIIQFLVNSQKSAFPNHNLNWDMMIETLCRAAVSLDIVKRLLDAHNESFSDQSINWQKAAQELTIRFLVEQEYLGYWRGTFFEEWEGMVDVFRASHAYQELIQSLLEIQQRFFIDQNNTNLQLFCEELVQPLKGWWTPSSVFPYTHISKNMLSFRFLVKCNIAQRLSTIGVRKWQMKIKNLVERAPSISDDKLETYFDTIHSNLVTYEREYHQLKDAAFLLELALWKSKIDESMPMDNMGQNDRLAAALREQCRINCGADIVIPNVLPYFID
jgi:hypothetical protein